MTLIKQPVVGDDETQLKSPRVFSLPRPPKPLMRKNK